ncbi:MAG: hypothetical protein HKO07_03585, partial [Pseudomonadales bacterium]|nr:hypothetical protein [Pseudomonadales bacterium]
MHKHDQQATANNEVYFSLQHVDVGFAEVPLINDVSLQLAKGDIAQQATDIT